MPSNCRRKFRLHGRKPTHLSSCSSASQQKGCWAKPGTKGRCAKSWGFGAERERLTRSWHGWPRELNCPSALPQCPSPIAIQPGLLKKHAIGKASSYRSFCARAPFRKCKNSRSFVLLLTCCQKRTLLIFGTLSTCALLTFLWIVQSYAMSLCCSLNIYLENFHIRYPLISKAGTTW